MALADVQISLPLVFYPLKLFQWTKHYVLASSHVWTPPARRGSGDIWLISWTSLKIHCLHICKLITNLCSKYILLSQCAEVAKGFRYCNHRLCFLLCAWGLETLHRKLIKPKESAEHHQTSLGRSLDKSLVTAWPHCQAFPLTQFIVIVCKNGGAGSLNNINEKGEESPTNGKRGEVSS